MGTTLLLFLTSFFHNFNTRCLSACYSSFLCFTMNVNSTFGSTTTTANTTTMLRNNYETEIFAIDRCRDNEQLSTQDKQGQMLQHQLTAYLLATSEVIRPSATLEERATAQITAYNLLREREQLWHYNARETINGSETVTLVSRVDSLLEDKREKRGFTPVLDKISYTSLKLETMMEQVYLLLLLLLLLVSLCIN
jgi:hypothetical protein